MKIENSEIFLIDNNSKFGSLVMMRDNYLISKENNKTALQIGRTFLSFNLKKKFLKKCEFCCRFAKIKKN